MVTKQMLEAMRAKRDTPNIALDYTPDNAAYGAQRERQAKQHERQIKLAERAMQDAQRHMRHDYKLARFRGQAKTHFTLTNHPSPHPTKEVSP